MDRYIGKRLDGRYEIREIIGVGGMAVVYKAYDAIENHIVAIKILKQEFVTNEEFVRRFKNESKAIAVLSHPNIVKVYDVSFGDLIQYIVMEYIEGITLKQYIESHGHLEWKVAVNIVMQILRALQHAHDKGIIHRDVKPQNIMLMKDGSIKVTDFGIARFARSEHKTMTDKAIGSVHYISPEQARGEITDEKADIYSVGVMLYEMLSGTLPFQADSAVIVAMMQLQNEAKPLREIDPTIPLGLSQITMNAMQKEILRRYQTAAEMLCDLETFRRDPSATFKHSYFVDNAPTKFVDTDNGLEQKEEKEQEEKSTSWVPIVTGVVVGIAILVVVWLVFYIFGKMNTTAKATKCPNFVGKTVDEIKTKYNIDDYTFDTIYEETSDYKVGEIIRQSPAPGTEIKKKNTIKLTIAQSAELIEVPDVKNDTESLARQRLKNAGFTDIVIEQIYDDVVNEGKVVKTAPLSPSLVSADETITLYISKGREIFYTTVPGILGCDEESAKKMLENEKLEVGKITEGESTQPKGYVISQSINADTQVEEGTKVNFVISSGNTAISNSIDVVVELPMDCAFDTGYVTAELESGDVLESSPLIYSLDGNYTFSIESTNSTETVKIKLLDQAKRNEYSYLNVKINFKKGSYEITKRFSNYPKAD